MSHKYAKITTNKAPRAASNSRGGEPTLVGVLTVTNYTSNLEIPYGYCHCGCGRKTALAPINNKRRNWLKGKPEPFVLGHGYIRTKTPEERFWEKVDKSSGEDACWLWTGYCDNKKGYGRIRWRGRPHVASRVAWEIAHGIPDDDLFVLHSCDNPRCVNPAHLFLGTNQDNIDDRERKNRNRPPRGEKHWCSKLTDSQVLEIRSRYAAGETNQRQLGREYGVSGVQIGNIIHNKHRIIP